MSKKITQAQINYIKKYGAKKAIQKYDELDLVEARRIEDEEQNVETFQGKRTLNKSKSSSRRNKKDDDEDLYESNETQGLHNLSKLGNNIASVFGMSGMQDMGGMMNPMGMGGMDPMGSMMLNPQASGMPIDPNMMAQAQVQTQQPNMNMFMGANGKVDPLHVEVMAPTMFGNMNSQQMSLPTLGGEFNGKMNMPQMTMPQMTMPQMTQMPVMSGGSGLKNLAKLAIRK
jgi:hypothetical protein